MDKLKKLQNLIIEIEKDKQSLPKYTLSIFSFFILSIAFYGLSYNMSGMLLTFVSSLTWISILGTISSSVLLFFKSSSIINKANYYEELRSS